LIWTHVLYTADIEGGLFVYVVAIAVTKIGNGRRWTVFIIVTII